MLVTGEAEAGSGRSNAIPYANNPRLHSAADIDRIAASIAGIQRSASSLNANAKPNRVDNRYIQLNISAPDRRPTTAVLRRAGNSDREPINMEVSMMLRIPCAALLLIGVVSSPLQAVCPSGVSTSFAVSAKVMNKTVFDLHKLEQFPPAQANVTYFAAGSGGYRDIYWRAAMGSS